MRYLILFIFFLQFILANANDSLEYKNKVYEKDIRTAYLRQTGTSESLPMFRLGQKNALTLQFDQLGTIQDYYNYTIVHCTYDWKPTDLTKMNYLEGEQFGYLPNGKGSQSTFQPFVHYSFSFPNDEMDLKLSGNYLLKVYRDFNEEDLILTMRFMVIDEQVIIETDVKRGTLPTNRYTSQEIDFTINHKDYTIPNPYSDSKAVIMQNNRWDNAIYNIAPQFSNASLLSYNYEKENVFDGLNEFRNFDIRSLRFMSNNVRKKYISEDNKKHVILYPEELKGTTPYLQFKDFNGKFVIDNKDGNNGELQGDYAFIHFNLLKMRPFQGDVYVVGEMNYWNLDSSYKMNYNSKLHTYQLQTPLKQGYYNYHYVVKEGDKLDYSETEGNNFETENDYQILFYHKNQYLGYYELVGSKYATTTILDK